MKLFKSEIREFPHPRSSENIRNVAARWGSVCGFKAAEAFEIIRKIKRHNDIKIKPKKMKKPRFFLENQKMCNQTTF